MSDTSNTEPRRRGGRPPKSTNTPRSPVGRAEPRAQLRDDVRDFKPRLPENRYDVPEHRKLKNWDYQWGVTHVLGIEAKDQMIDRYANGWRPCEAWEFPELSMVEDKDAENAKDHIVRGGQRLERRPMQYTQKIRAIEDEKARDQVKNQVQRLQLGDDGVKKKVKLERQYVPMTADE
jgi:hypothetical protein